MITIPLFTIFVLSSGFIPPLSHAPSRRSFSLVSAGFSKGEDKAEKPMTAGAQERKKLADKYDDLTAAGGQEYRVFVRQFGETDAEAWFPCGAVVVPRGAQVADAIYANEERLKESITRQFKNLKGKEQEMEFGFNLKVYPDDPVEVAVKDNTNRVDKLNPLNWLSTLLSPVDTSKSPDK